MGHPAPAAQRPRGAGAVPDPQPLDRGLRAGCPRPSPPPRPAVRGRRCQPTPRPPKCSGETGLTSERRAHQPVRRAALPQLEGSGRGARASARQEVPPRHPPTGGACACPAHTAPRCTLHPAPCTQPPAPRLSCRSRPALPRPSGSAPSLSSVLLSPAHTFVCN